MRIRKLVHDIQDYQENVISYNIDFFLLIE